MLASQAEHAGPIPVRCSNLIIMKHEKSCGVVTYIKLNNEIRYLLERQNNGFLSFPKGHVENNETELETAKRELLEETGLTADIKEGFREVINYYIPQYDVDKDVVLFVGEIDSLDYHRQEKEIADIVILDYQEAYNQLEFDNWKNVLKKADAFIKKL